MPLQVITRHAVDVNILSREVVEQLHNQVNQRLAMVTIITIAMQCNALFNCHSQLCDLLRIAMLLYITRLKKYISLTIISEFVIYEDHLSTI